MTSVRIDLSELTKGSERIVRELTPRRVLTAIGNRHLAWINENFDVAGLERPWKPLASSTVAGRRRGSSKPLQDTGKLRQSFVMSLGTTAVRVGSPSPIAPIHQFGTGPYTIKPVKAKALRFLGPAGQVLFAKSVNHPGITARPMLPSQRLATTLAVKEYAALVRVAAARFNR